MNSMSTIGLFIFLAAALLSRVVSEQALRTLTPEQKVSILDAFSSMRAYSLIPVILLVALIFGLPAFVPNSSWWSAGIGLGGSLLFIVVFHVVAARKLKTAPVPESYKRRVLLSRHISHAGLVLLFGSFIYDGLQASP